jgi:hypothetical protein
MLGGYNRLWHMVGRAGTTRVDYIPLSGTNNLAKGQTHLFQYWSNRIHGRNYRLLHSLNTKKPNQWLIPVRRIKTTFAFVFFLIPS